jgi:preprotein translocase subunit SecD
LRNILREERIGYTGMTVRGDTVEVRVRDVWDMPQAMRRIGELADPKFEAMRPVFPKTENVTLSPKALGWTAAPGELSPAPRVDVAIEGQLFRLKMTDFAIGERTAARRNRSMELIKGRWAAMGVKSSIRAVGMDRIVVDSAVSLQFERWFHLIQ